MNVIATLSIDFKVADCVIVFFCVSTCSGLLMQDSRVASLEKDLSAAKDELIRLRSLNLSVNKDQIESLKIREMQLKDKVHYCQIVTMMLPLIVLT